MRKLLPLLVLLASLPLGGCVILHSTTDIAADGSGTAAMSIAMSASVQDALVQMKELDAGQSSDMDFPMFDDIDRERIEKAAAGHGVKVARFERAETDGLESIEIRLEFDDLKGLSFVMNNILGDGGSSDGMGIFDAGQGNLVLKQAEYDFPAPPAAEEEAETPAAPESQDPAEMDPDQMAKQMEIMGTLMGAMAELDVKLEITVPGDIVSTNAPASDGRTSIWSINAQNMMSMDQDMNPEIVFAGKGLKIKPLKESP